MHYELKTLIYETSLFKDKSICVQLTVYYLNRFLFTPIFSIPKNIGFAEFFISGLPNPFVDLTTF